MNNTPIAINGTAIISNGYFAYDGCHKIYITENEDEAKQAMDMNYVLIPIELIEDYYKKSCPLKFIHPFNLIGDYCQQGEEAVFTY